MVTLLVPPFTSGSEIVAFGRDLDGAREVTLDFSSVGFAMPSGMVLLSQFIAQAVRDGRVIGFTGAAPYGYPANMGFFDICGLDVPKHNAPGNENYLPLQAIDLNEWRAYAVASGLPFGQLADQRVGRMAFLLTRTYRGDLFDLLKYCLREIVRNSLEHGEGSTLWVSGQYWPYSHEVELSIYDNGIGIRSAITQNMRFSSINNDRDAIRLAIMPSTSGKKLYASANDIDCNDGLGQWSNSGFGLYITSQIARGCGSFVVGSGASYQEISGHENKKGEFGLSGTFVSLRLHVGGLRLVASAVSEIAQKGESFARRHFASGAEVLASAASKFLVS
jgi:hypothetical protein